MPDGRDEDTVRAAGAVVWRPAAKGPQIALVHRPRYDDWSFPKGKCERDEHVLLGAVREVEEETGLRIVLGRPLRPLEYRSGGRPKRVSYWVARCTSAAGFVPGDEVDEVAWLPVSAAGERLSYERDVALLEEFRTRPVLTVPLILLRHASAGRKGATPADDLARPLDEQGVRDAKLLAELLACYGPSRVVSSAAERCLATVRPYAAAAGAMIEVEPAITQDRGEVPGAVRGPEPRRAGPDAASRAAALAAAGVPTVICGHRENLPAMLEAACSTLRSATPEPAPLPKGAFWVLQSAGGVLVSAERHSLAE